MDNTSMLQQLALIKLTEERRLYREVYMQSLKSCPTQSAISADNEAGRAVLSMRSMFDGEEG